MADLKKASQAVWFGNEFVAAGTVLPAGHTYATHPAFVDFVPGEPVTPGAPPPPEPIDDIDALRAEAEAAGVTVDKRWGVARLREEIAEAE
jgi:hypothetical protein